MEHESFEDEETARLQNELFVNVKVDREERPDLDAIYMDAVVTLTGHGGWPLTVFLTPEGEPFYGGTYFPPEPRHGLPSFRQVLEAVSSAYRERRGEVSRSAAQLVSAVEQAGRRSPSSEPLTESLLERGGSRACAASFDPEWGGFGRAPKFPPHSVLELLLRRGETELVEPTLDGMAAGGMYDLVGGGFHRYSVDERWLVPHFEKMLYDNALLVPAYLHGWLVTGRERYREVAEETVDYMLRDLLLPEGAFASSQDADTDGVEGLTYTWTADDAVPARAALAVRARALDRPRRARSRAAPAAARDPRPSDRSRGSTTRRSRPGTASPSPRWPRRRGAWSATTGSTLPDDSAEFLLGPALGRRTATAQLPGRHGDGHRLPRRLRQRRARSLRAARGDGRAAVARGVAPARAARRGALRRRRARRLLPDARRRRGARRAYQGPRRQPDAVGQLDARLRAATAGADLRRRRAGAPRRLRPAPRPRPRAAGTRRVRVGALRARSPLLAAAGDRRRRLAGRRCREGGARRLRPERRRRLRPLGGGAPTRRARTSWTASPPSTCASASPARRPSQIQPR